MDVTIIGHGSLMSGTGLAFSGVLQVAEARIVALANCRRGFAKLSKYGDRFATDLEVPQFPLRARVAHPAAAAQDTVEGLALSVPFEDACQLAKREGYAPAAMQQLMEIARGEALSLAEFLWQLLLDAEHDVVRYRRQLCTLAGFTSPHYIPHPVQIETAEYALLFLAPGMEGTGSADVVSVRQQTGIHSIMNTAETWRRKPNEDQLSYFVSCLLAGVHGISVHELLASLASEPALAQQLRSRLAPQLEEEITRFLATTGFTPARYQQAFGDAAAALARSGLAEFLAG